jgi:anti-sigma factor RsiW
MTGHVIRLHGEHDEVQALMPWYASGTLDASDLARVEAHLGGCPECQAELRLERRLKSEIADLPVDVEEGWATLRGRLDIGRPNRTRGAVRAWLAASIDQARRSWRSAPPWLGWALAAQGAAILIIGVLATPATQSARYHALGAAPVAAAGNVVVIFRPDTREAMLRQTLRRSHARLVDGPTAADAYLLSVPGSERSAILAELRGQPDIVMAEPVDAGGPP